MFFTYVAWARTNFSGQSCVSEFGSRDGGYYVEEVCICIDIKWHLHEQYLEVSIRGQVGTCGLGLKFSKRLLNWALIVWGMLQVVW